MKLRDVTQFTVNGFKQICTPWSWHCYVEICQNERTIPDQSV